MQITDAETLIAILPHDGDRCDLRLFMQHKTSKDIKDSGLWMVICTLKRKGYANQEHQTESVPATSIYYVLAEDGEAAISQVRDATLGVGQEDALHAGRLMEEGRLAARAVRLPLHVRGWGLTTF